MMLSFIYSPDISRNVHKIRYNTCEATISTSIMSKNTQNFHLPNTALLKQQQHNEFVSDIYLHNREPAAKLGFTIQRNSSPNSSTLLSTKLVFIFGTIKLDDSLLTVV